MLNNVMNSKQFEEALHAIASAGLRGVLREVTTGDVSANTVATRKTVQQALNSGDWVESNLHNGIAAMRFRVRKNGTDTHSVIVDFEVEDERKEIEICEDSSLTNPAEQSLFLSSSMCYAFSKILSANRNKWLLTGKFRQVLDNFQQIGLSAAAYAMNYTATAKQNG